MRKLEEETEKGSSETEDDLPPEILEEKRKLEEGNLPDEKTCEMDLKNNEIGVQIGKDNKNTSQEELIQIVKQMVLEGKLWKICKDENGEFLDWNGGPINMGDFQGMWQNPKFLVPSDYEYVYTELNGV